METATATSASKAHVPWYKDAVSAYDRWVAAQGIPVHEGHHVSDLRTLPLGAWPERGCSGAFLKLAGQEAVSEARVSEIAPGQTLPPLKFGFDELVYVVDGRGLTTVWREDGGPSTSFEWQTHSLFLIPRHYRHQFSNVQGERPARLFHYNYLPFVMDAIPDASFYFENGYVGPAPDAGSLSDLYSEAKAIHRDGPGGGTRLLWVGNFFPDMLAWDKFSSGDQRGFASHLVGMRYPNSPLTSHMAVFPPFTYKKAHRHGPGVVIIVLAGEGFSVMWPEDQEDKSLLRWQAGSVFVPPNRWFHQHFNASGTPARYLALHSAPSILGYGERVEDLARDQIEYTDEDPWIRQTFEGELASRGLRSEMPDALYHDRNYREPSSRD
jgi:oxalate decarboxylase/phosphoglucose isomerase-like protein (cupin superfamily)